MRFVFITLVISLLGICPARGQAVHYGSNARVGRYVRVNDIRVYVEEYGHGAPLILLHGNGGSIKAFSKQIPFLARHFHVVAMDSRAQGRSYDSDRELSFALMASDVAALIDTLRLDSAFVIGWSDGAVTGLELAMRYPGKVRKLVAIGANFRADTSAFTPAMIRDSQTELVRLPDSLELEDIRRLSPQPDRAGLTRRKLIELDLKYPTMSDDDLHSIIAPTLVVAGDHDLIKLEHILRLYQTLPHAYLFIVPAARHSLIMEKPELFNGIVLDFLMHPYRTL